MKTITIQTRIDTNLKKNITGLPIKQAVFFMP